MAARWDRLEASEEEVLRGETDMARLRRWRLVRLAGIVVFLVLLYVLLGRQHPDLMFAAITVAALGWTASLVVPYLLAGQNKWLVTDRRLLTSQKLEGGGFRCARLDEIHTLRISMGSVSISHAGGRPIRLPYPGDPQTVATAIHRSMERRAEARNKP